MPSNTLVIYKSSAGSGKTYTLVLEYLKLVLKQPSLYRSILAITFTNKATEEMKSRIIGALVEISENREEKLQETIAAQTGIAIQKLPEQATKVLDNIMHDYSGFSVSTIDSFFSKIVRSLARELNLPLRFDIELNIDSVIGEITTMLMDEIGTNEWLKKWLQEFIFDKLNQNKSWKIDADIHEMAKELFKESFRTMFPEGHARPDTHFVDELRGIVKGFESRMTDYGTAFMHTMVQNNLEIEDFHYGKGGVAGYFQKLTRKLKVAEYIPGTRFNDAREDSSKWASKKSKNRELIVTLAENHLMSIASDVDDEIKLELPRYTGAKLVLNTIYIAGIYSMLDEKLREFRAENEIVLISDTNALLQKSIEGQDAPFIYEKTGNRYSHFMLDEFQDTSDYQWQNLLPLIENALGSGNYTMIVGDAKQSIYRWRGGNMQLLIKGIQESLGHYNEITQLKTLGENYRSREQIVNFNNIFFKNVPNILFPTSENEIHKSAYNPKDLTQEWKKGNPGEGYVKIKFVDTINGNQNEDEQAETDDEGIPNGWIEQACEENYKILNKVIELGFEFRDIAFLTRTNKDAKLITEFLISKGIDRIISPESMLLNKSQSIQFLISALSFIDEQDNYIVLAHLVFYYNVIRKKNDQISLNEIFASGKAKKLELLPESFSKKLNYFRKIPLYEAVEELSAIFELGNPPDAYLQRFLDLILEFSKQHPANITDFLEWWEENQEKDTCSVIIPSGENAIRVMSVHKSKGLQFPVVIMPFADWELTPKNQSVLWVASDQDPFNSSPKFPVKIGKDLQHSVFKKDYEQEQQHIHVDNLNLLYVAFTRAEEHLYIVSRKPTEKKLADATTIPAKAGHLIYKTLQSDELLSANLDESNGIFEKGTLSKPFRTARKESGLSKNLQDWHSLSWKPRLKMGISKKKISINDPDTPETRYGLLYHLLVSEISSIVDPEVFVKTHSASSGVESDMQQKLIKEIKMFVEAANTHGWFGADSETINEAELMLTDGSVLRPDRLILKGNQAIIIDYKTGVEEAYHEEQVIQYATVLKEMGYAETKIFLVYPAFNKVVEVNAA